MSGPWHPTSRAPVSARNPRAQGRCDRCGFNYALTSLKWQYEWQGLQLQNLRILVCDVCLDKPQIQLKTIILPPDPLPVFNPRPEPYNAEVPSYLQIDTGQILITTTGLFLTTEIEVTPTPNPDAPYLVPPDF